MASDIVMNELEVEVKVICREDELVLNITDHHRWGKDDRQHLAVIVREIKSFISTVISGEVYALYPESKGKARIIEIVGKHPLNEESNRVFQLLEKSSSFRIRVFQE